MTTAGTLVKGGFYLNRDAWDLVAISGKEGILPGSEGQRFLKVPAWAVLALAPVLGGLFVVFLPLIGFALVFMYLARATLTLGRRTVRSLVLLVAPSWRPGEAYFAGKDKKTTEAAAPPTAKDGRAKTGPKTQA